MADARDLKSLGRKVVRVRVPPPPPFAGRVRAATRARESRSRTVWTGNRYFPHTRKGLRMGETASAETAILNKYGFHVRPSTQFMQKAREFGADITVEVDGVRADGKSIMQLMALGAMQGARVKITASGSDANEAVASLVALIQSRFGGID